MQPSQGNSGPNQRGRQSQQQQGAAPHHHDLNKESLFEKQKAGGGQSKAEEKKKAEPPPSQPGVVRSGLGERVLEALKTVWNDLPFVREAKVYDHDKQITDWSRNFNRNVSFVVLTTSLIATTGGAAALGFGGWALGSFVASAAGPIWGTAIAAAGATLGGFFGAHFGGHVGGNLVRTSLNQLNPEAAKLSSYHELYGKAEAEHQEQDRRRKRNGNGSPATHDNIDFSKQMTGSAATGTSANNPLNAVGLGFENDDQGC